MVRIVGVLTIIALISGVSLALFADFTAEKRRNNEILALQKALSDIFPEMTKSEKPVDTSKFTDKEKIKTFQDVYKVIGDNDKCLGYAFKAIGQGFSDKIEMLVGVNPDFTRIKYIEILKQIETPGLGAKIEETFFKDKFKNLNCSEEITYVKNVEPEKDSQIQAITGATISSRAVVTILNNYIPMVRKEVLK